MKILIIEDEIPASDQLIATLIKYDRKIDILEILDSNKSVLEWFNKPAAIPDLIFSDIELLDGVVFNSLIELNLTIPIIFTTAYQKFAIDAFNTSGIAYLLKPINPADLHKAMQKFQDLTGTNTTTLKEILKNLEMSSRKSFKSRFPVKVGQGIYILKTEDISCLRMKNGVLYAYKSNGKFFILSQSLGDTMEQLNPSSFFQINRSDVVNIHFLEKVEAYYNDRLALFINGQNESLITSASKTSEFRKWLEDD